MRDRDRDRERGETERDREKKKIGAHFVLKSSVYHHTMHVLFNEIMIYMA